MSYSLSRSWMRNTMLAFKAVDAVSLLRWDRTKVSVDLINWVQDTRYLHTTASYYKSDFRQQRSQANHSWNKENDSKTWCTSHVHHNERLFPRASVSHRRWKSQRLCLSGSFAHWNLQRSVCDILLSYCKFPSHQHLPNQQPQQKLSS